MTKLTLALIAVAGLCLPATALANDCPHVRNVDTALELGGATRVAFDVGRHDLVVRGDTGTAGRIAGRACASSQADLDAMRVVQVRRGDTLHVTLEGPSGNRWGLFGNRQAAFDLAAMLPEGVPVTLELGSGDATVANVPSLQADVGSGDLSAGDIAGEVAIEVGSGDVALKDIGALRVDGIGSGDVTASRVRGDVAVGSIGSGDLAVYGATGDIAIDSLGSGDVGLRNIGGGVRVGSVGSGDVQLQDVGGDVVVRSVGSGDVGHRGVRGRIDLPSDN